MGRVEWGAWAGLRVCSTCVGSMASCLSCLSSCCVINETNKKENYKNVLYSFLLR